MSDYAARELFGALGITCWHRPRDPDGVDLGHSHLRLSATSLAALGNLWLRDGVAHGRRDGAVVVPRAIRASIRARRPPTRWHQAGARPATSSPRDPYPFS